MKSDPKEIRERFDKLLSIMKQLRSPGGCPWDREQTHRSLISCLVEETAELTEALLSDDEQLLIEELGDVLLQVVFHAELAREEGRFDMGDVLDVLSNKLITRHPHVFGAGVRLGSAGEVTTQWEAIKKGEKEKANRKSLMDGIPLQLPALQYAAKVQSRAAKVGFDWPDRAGVMGKMEEELAELEEVIGEKEQLPPDASAAVREEVDLHLEEELGDLLFTVVNLSRHLGVTPEQALQVANRKFSKRFRAMEAIDPQLMQRSPEELEEMWRQVKLKDSSSPSV